MTPDWQLFTKITHLLPDQVHVVSVNVTQHLSSLAVYWNSLSQDEKERADRFHFEKDKNRFVVARGGLRRLLAHYLQQVPEQIAFQTKAQGKLYLPAYSSLEFNVSHSGNYVLYGFSINYPVGIDVESDERELECFELAERFFHEEEYRQLQQLPLFQQKESFYQLWTGKEAIVKAIGTGLSHSLKAFAINLITDEVTFFENSQTETSWKLISFFVSEHYPAAVAYPDKPLVLKFYHLPAN